MVNNRTLPPKKRGRSSGNQPNSANLTGKVVNTQATNKKDLFNKLQRKYGKWLSDKEIHDLIAKQNGNISAITKKAYEKATLKYYSNAMNASGPIVKSITDIVRERLTAPECPCGPAPPVPKFGSVVRAVGSAVGAFRTTPSTSGQ